MNSVVIDGDRIVCAYYKTVKIYKFNTFCFKTMETYDNKRTVHSVAIDGDKIIGGLGTNYDSDGYAMRWNINTGKRLDSLDPPEGVRIGDVISVVVNGDRIVTGSSQNCIMIWEKKLDKDKPEFKLINTLWGPLIGGGNSRALAINNDYIVAGYKYFSITIMNRKGEVIKTLNDSEKPIKNGHKNSINSIAINGDLIASASDDKTIKVWSIETGKLMNTLKGHTNGVLSVAIDAKYIVSGSKDNTMKIWNINTGECIKSLEHSQWVSNVCINKDRIVSGSNDDIIKIWTKEGDCLQTIAIDTGAINCCRGENKPKLKL